MYLMIYSSWGLSANTHKLQGHLGISGVEISSPERLPQKAQSSGN